MYKELLKMEQQIECSTCQWNQNCIDPPSMTEAEVKAKIDETKPKEDGENTGDSMMSGLMTAMLFSGKERESRVCLTFANALRSGPELTQQIKAIMQGK